MTPRAVVATVVFALGSLLIVSVGAGAWSGPSGDPLAALHARELPWVRAFQGDGSLGRLAQAISDVGPSHLLWAVLGFLFFCVDPRVAVRAGVFLAVGLWVREMFAMTAQSPRPYWVDDTLHTFADGAMRRPTFSFPSGHAMIGLGFWWYLAAEARAQHWWRHGWIVAALLGLLIGLSRPYLGVHWFSDVLMGWTMGWSAAELYRHLETRWAARVAAKGPRGWVTLGLFGGLLWILSAWLMVHFWSNRPAPDDWAALAATARRLQASAQLGGVLLGLGLAVALTRGWLVPLRPWWKGVLVFGIVGAIVKGGLDPAVGWGVRQMGDVLPASLAWIGPFFQQGFLIAIAWGLAPWILLRAGWARIEPIGSVRGSGPALTYHERQGT